LRPTQADVAIVLRASRASRLDGNDYEEEKEQAEDRAESFISSVVEERLFKVIIPAHFSS
jgi:hypothetical protein